MGDFIEEGMKFVIRLNNSRKPTITDKKGNRIELYLGKGKSKSEYCRRMEERIQKAFMGYNKYRTGRGFKDIQSEDEDRGEFPGPERYFKDKQDNEQEAGEHGEDDSTSFACLCNRFFGGRRNQRQGL